MFELLQIANFLLNEEEFSGLFYYTLFLLTKTLCKVLFDCAIGLVHCGVVFFFVE